MQIALNETMKLAGTIAHKIPTLKTNQALAESICRDLYKSN